MKMFLLALLPSAGFTYITAAVLGLALSPQRGEPLDPERVREALEFAFPATTDWSDVEGAVSHRWLVRRAFVSGVDDDAGTLFSEQILKIGWPFTIVRGFDRRSDSRVSDVDSIGVGWVSGEQLGQPRRLLPLLPVWPGLAVCSVTLAAAFSTAIHLSVRRRASIS